MATFAPNLDNVVAMPAPSPVPPPVTNATLPLKVFPGSIGVFLGKKN